MVLRVHKLSLNADLAVLGLDSVLPPYALAGRLNQVMGWNLVRSLKDAELTIPLRSSSMEPSQGPPTVNPLMNLNGKLSREGLSTATPGADSSGRENPSVSFFQLFFQKIELYDANLCLVSNRGSLGLLLPKLRNFNFLMTWPKEAVEFSDVLLHRRIGDLEGVNIAADITTRISTQTMSSLQFDPVH
jgi:hypothetical protein